MESLGIKKMTVTDLQRGKGREKVEIKAAGPFVILISAFFFISKGIKGDELRLH